MKTPYPHIAVRPAVSSKTLFKLERKGRYEDALAEVRHLWPDLSTMPDVTALDARDAAEILLRFGSLIGFLGHVRPIPSAQEKSKNLLTEARTRFLEIYDIEKIAECENYLALAYWRTGEINEAEAWIDESQSHDLPQRSFHRLYSHSIKCLTLLKHKEYRRIIAYLLPLERDFLSTQDNGLKGDFFNNCAVAYQELGHPDEAVKCYEKARDHYHKAGHKTYLGIIENNLAMLYLRLGMFEEARNVIDDATKVFRLIKDRTREGFSLDTKAQILLAEGKYEAALKTLEKAIAMLRKTENSAYLIEAHMTRVKTLVYLDDISGAALVLVDAVAIARAHTGEESAKALTREFELALKERPAVSAALSPTEEVPGSKNETVGDGIQLVLPPSISHYTDYQGVWINGTHLEKAGLAKGSLAVVVKEDVKRGDLVAIAEIGNDMVSCGYYDAEFGMTCLEGADGDLQMFDEQDVRILGRIVGVCNTGKNPDGKMIVEPVNK
jgi:tetratricopeptide (TPR) repeat protein